MTKVLTSKIEALTTYANGITGKNDTTLSDAVASLANGYGAAVWLLSDRRHIDAGIY